MRKLSQLLLFFQTHVLRLLAWLLMLPFLFLLFLILLVLLTPGDWNEMGIALSQIPL